MKTVLIFLDHGLGVAYFFDTILAKLLTDKDVRLVFLLQEALLPKMREEHKLNDHLIFLSMREAQASHYKNHHFGGLQEIINYLRGSTATPRIPLTYVDTNRRRKNYEAKGRWKFILKLFSPVISLMRRSRIARNIFRWKQQIFFTSNIYSDYFEEYKPELVVSCTAGWRIDRYFLREAIKRKIKTATVIIGWDNPSANGLPGANVEFVNVWSEIHKRELNKGVDWPLEKIHVGGMPLYDGYVNGKWLISRDEYFRMHGLDPNRKLVTFAATALSISPNLHIVEILADIIAKGKLSEPSQLLIRLHPNHFKPTPRYEQEREAIYEIVKKNHNLHIVEPKALAGNLPRYSGEDYPEKTSMFKHSDVLVTIYSTMALEAAMHDTPIVSACIDTEAGWKDYFWVPLSTVPNWPTAARMVDTKAGRTAYTAEELTDCINAYLGNHDLEKEERHNFAKQELVYLDGSSTKVTADFILSLLD